MGLFGGGVRRAAGRAAGDGLGRTIGGDGRPLWGGIGGRGGEAQPGPAAGGGTAKSSKSRGSSRCGGAGGGMGAGASKSSQDSVVGGVGGVGSMDVSWPATCPESWGRRSGVVASSLATSVDSPTGTSARLRAGIGSPRILSTRSPGCSPRRPGWGERPVRAKCNTAPRPYRSVSSFRVPVRNVSGGKYSMACNGSLVNACLSVTPKSPTAGSLSSRKRMLLGEMPPWTTPTPWAAVSAEAIARPSTTTSAADSGPTRSTRPASDWVQSSILSADSPEGISSTPSTIKIDVTRRTVDSFACSLVNADIVRLSKRLGNTFTATGTPALCPE